MKAKWAIGLSIIVIMLGVLLSCQREAKPQVAGGYGASHLYVDEDWELWTDVRSMEANDGVDIGDVTVNNPGGAAAVNIQDGGNNISVDDGGTDLSIDVSGIPPAIDAVSSRLGVIAFDDAVASDGNTNEAAWAFIGGGDYRAVLIKNEIFNGTTWDRERNNVEATILASAERATDTVSADQINYNGSRLLLIMNVSAINATPIVTPTLWAKDSVSSEYFTVWMATTPLTAVGTTAYYFGDGASGGSFTEILAFGLPSRTWVVTMLHDDADAITYTVGANIGIH